MTWHELLNWKDRRISSALVHTARDSQGRLRQAKVFESDEADEKTAPDVMAKAVSHKVEIISISAGFTTATDRLRTAIHEAHATNIIVFAAASNWGNTERVAYPARMKDHVLCMFATMGNLKSHRDINPEWRRNADNFALLGHDNELPGHSGHVSGTSAATALAAGMAGRILDFERYYMPQKKQKNTWTLSSKAGMSAVFRAMASSSENYDCIHPKRLLSLCDEEDDKETERERVHEFIIRALQDAE
ncbi:hypothetical protein CKAH01_05722 [Colletotrichum kahawae]|uniref:Peptidase S8/S53 domain-containing protein n=1 Tax=Colletotrichum kahawae TaxID=34407 RepID=A0AAD9YDJ6_COLKA|nr:hypothetical protein CKAH01_05722 [Colletotrichum kahawae]